MIYIYDICEGQYYHFFYSAPWSGYWWVWYPHCAILNIQHRHVNIIDILQGAVKIAKNSWANSQFSISILGFYNTKKHSCNACAKKHRKSKFSWLFPLRFVQCGYHTQQTCFRQSKTQFYLFSLFKTRPANNLKIAKKTPENNIFK